MAPQKCKKKNLAEIIGIFECHPKAVYSLDSSRPYCRLLQNQKTRGSRELFLPENDY